MTQAINRWQSGGCTDWSILSYSYIFPPYSCVSVQIHGYLHRLTTLVWRKLGGSLAQVGETFLAPMGKGHCGRKGKPASLAASKSYMIPVSRDSFHSSGIKVFFSL